MGIAYLDVSVTNYFGQFKAQFWLNLAQFQLRIWLNLAQFWLSLNLLVFYYVTQNEVGYMTQKDRISEIILQLKQIRKERDLSLQDVHDLIISSGRYLSLSSVKRVFAEGSEELGFRYQDTIQPIVGALLGVTEETPENNDITANEIDALKNVILLKDTIINELQTKNEALSLKTEKLESDSAYNIEEARRKIDFLLKQTEQQGKEIDYLIAENIRKSNMIDKLVDKYVK